MADALSTTAQCFGLVGLLLVPLGLGWLAHDWTRRRAGKSGRPVGTSKACYFALTAVCTSLPVAGFTSLAASARALLLGLIVMGLWLYWAAKTVPKLRRLKGTSPLASVHPAPLCLVIVPVVLTALKFTLLPSAVESSRNRGIAAGAAMLADIETYRAAKGHYPVSLAGATNDYRPKVVGIGRLQYEPSGRAYNVSFEQFSDRFGTREFVVYNPLDEHQVYSHDMDRVRLPPRPLRGGGGQYAVHDALHPNWKYFWFD
ncbi:MAG: hypothetical protein H7Y88_08155 [Phycisphaerales bacterium]|nr:hypothetical protein [Phycisphaerales bacterium]